MNVLITGGAGYLGCELVKMLSHNSAIKQIVIYDNLSRNNYALFSGYSGLDSKKIKFLEADILDSVKLNKALKEIDCVYHLAAKVTTPFSSENPSAFDQINRWGSAELSYAISKNNIKKAILVSSVSVYGGTEKVTDHTIIKRPETAYGISKMHAEEYFQNLPCEVYILRCGNVYGYSPAMRFDAVINKLLFEAHFKGRISIHGSGDQYRPFIDINRVSAFLNSIVEEKVAPNIYNLVSANLSVNEIADGLKKLYPHLEFLYLNQQMPMKSLQVQPDALMLPTSEIEFSQHLMDFKAKFSF